LEDRVPQLTLYVDETTAQKIRARAAASGVSLSRWVADLVQERTATQWPAEVVALAGQWREAPDAKELRDVQGSDLPREAW